MAQEKRLLRMTIQGMTCEDCERHVARALAGAGAVDVEADWRKGMAVFRLDPEVDEAPLFKAVSGAGYSPLSVEPQRDPGSPVKGKIPEGRVSAGRVLDAGRGPGEYDLAVIGSGSAAFSAAIEAVGLGARVAMIERGTVGGTCVNVGCVPSKALLRAAEVRHLAANHPFAGVETSAGEVDLGRLTAQKDELVASMRRQKYEDLIADYGFDLIRGEARFSGPRTVQAAGGTVSAGKFIVATGAAPWIPDIPGLADGPYLTSETALKLDRVPGRLLVIGSGYIALELGQMFRRLGARVTLAQRGERFLGAHEPEVAEAVAKVLAEDGIEQVLGVQYERVDWSAGGVRVAVRRGESRFELEGDALLVAAGRAPNTAGLRLDLAGIQTGTRGEILVDSRLATRNPDVYAAGDVTMGPQFVYVAAYEGAAAARNAVGGADREVDLSVVPAVTFTSPAIASVGLTEAEARRRGIEPEVSVLPAGAVTRAAVNRETRGVFKLVADRQTRRILGAHIVADNAGDVIYAAELAVKFGLTAADLRETLAPYLTMAEGLRLAALTFDKDVAKLSCCAG